MLLGAADGRSVFTMVCIGSLTLHSADWMSGTFATSSIVFGRDNTSSLFPELTSISE